jgi:enterochelin esterase family protein
VGPLRPDDYLYRFTVDGVPTPDPGNPTVHQGTHAVQNVLHIPGPGIEFAENQPVPHGEIRQVRYLASVTGSARRMHVYTPPGYEAGTSRYPVLYLLHGGGDDDSSWANIGRAGFILDNLLAAKKAQPMIVVMPDLNKPRPEGVRPVGGIMAQTDDFTNELMRDILPLVERNYRVLSGAQNRAVAGVSVGGYTTLDLLAHKNGEFGEFGIWSAPVEPKTVAEAKTRYAPLFDHPEVIAQGGKRVWLRVGEKDAGAASVRALADLLEKQGIPHDLRVSAGGHRWSPWRRYLCEFAQAVFLQSRR